MRRYLPRLSAAIAAALLVLVGCASETPPTRLYVLSSLSDAEPASQAAAGNREVALGVGPINLPEYLDRLEIVTRTTQNKLRLGEFDQWGEPLEQNFAAVLAENLSILVPTEQVAVFPWERSTMIDYEIAVRVIRFEVKAGGESMLIARWSIIEEGGREPILVKRSSYTAPVQGSGYEATVWAMNDNLADLSRDIATALKNIASKKS